MDPRVAPGGGARRIGALGWCVLSCLLWACDGGVPAGARAFTWVPEDVVGAIATEGGDATVGMIGTRRYADGSTERVSDLTVSESGGDVRVRIVGPTTSVWREFGSIAIVDGVTVVRHDNGTALGDAFTVEVRPHGP